MLDFHARKLFPLTASPRRPPAGTAPRVLTSQTRIGELRPGRCPSTALGGPPFVVGQLLGEALPGGVVEGVAGRARQQRGTMVLCHRVRDAVAGLVTFLSVTFLCFCLFS